MDAGGSFVDERLKIRRDADKTGGKADEKTDEKTGVHATTIEGRPSARRYMCVKPLCAQTHENAS